MIYAYSCADSTTISDKEPSQKRLPQSPLHSLPCHTVSVLGKQTLGATTTKRTRTRTRTGTRTKRVLCRRVAMITKSFLALG